MTDITPRQDVLSRLSSLIKQKGKEADRSGQTVDFSKVLMEHLDTGDTETIVPGSSGGLPELDATTSARLAQLTDTAPELPQEVSLSIDRLETYAQWLSDPSKTLREVHGLLDEIDAGINALHNRLKDTPDHELEGIVTHISTLVAVEKIKLNRGDYT